MAEGKKSRKQGRNSMSAQAKRYAAEGRYYKNKLARIARFLRRHPHYTGAAEGIRRLAAKGYHLPADLRD